MHGYVGYPPMYHREVHPNIEQYNRNPNMINPLTAGLIGAGLGFIGGGILAGGPDYGPGYGPGYFPGPGYGPWYGPGYGPGYAPVYYEPGYGYGPTPFISAGVAFPGLGYY